MHPASAEMFCNTGRCCHEEADGLPEHAGLAVQVGGRREANAIGQKAALRIRERRHRVGDATGSGLIPRDGVGVYHREPRTSPQRSWQAARR
jgi:hypothetical protein